MILFSYNSRVLMLISYSSQKQKTRSPLSCGGEDSLLPTHEVTLNEEARIEQLDHTMVDICTRNYRPAPLLCS